MSFHLRRRHRIRGKWVATWQNKQNGCASSEDSDQPGHPPSLIRVFAVRMKKAWVLSYPLSAQRGLWSDWADAQADPSLRWVHSHFIGFVVSWLKWHLHVLWMVVMHQAYTEQFGLQDSVQTQLGNRHNELSNVFDYTAEFFTCTRVFLISNDPGI